MKREESSINIPDEVSNPRDRFGGTSVVSRLLKYILLFASYFLVACVITWPLIVNLNNGLPQGTETSGTVPLFNLWTLRWNADRIFHLYQGYWNAPIFYPTQFTFALSDPQPLTGLIFTLVHVLTGNAVASYNLILLLALTMNGVGARFLLIKVGVVPGPAFLGGLLALGLPYIANELGVLQLTMLFPVFFTFSALLQFRQTPTLRAALLLGGWTGATCLFSSYYAIYLSIFMIIGVLFFVQKKHLTIKAFRNLLCCVLLTVAIVLPVLPVQLEVTEQYPRSLESIRKTCAEPVDYIRLHRNAWGYKTASWLRTKGGSKHYLYPGTGLLMLAVFGWVIGRRSPTKRWVHYCATGVLLTFLLSLGLKLSIGGWQPYELLRECWPGFHQLRNSHRFASFMQIFMVGLAGFGLMSIWRWRGAVGPRLATAFVICSLLEVLAVPAKIYQLPESLTEAKWIQTLHELPPGPVAMIPFPKRRRSRLYEPITLGMLQGLEHGKPLINGYSGLFPKGYKKLRERMKAGLSRTNLRHLRKRGTRYIVVDVGWIIDVGHEQLEGLKRNNELRLLYVDPVKLVFEIT